MVCSNSVCRSGSLALQHQQATEVGARFGVVGAQFYRGSERPPGQFTVHMQHRTEVVVRFGMRRIDFDGRFMHSCIASG